VITQKIMSCYNSGKTIYNYYAITHNKVSGGSREPQRNRVNNIEAHQFFYWWFCVSKRRKVGRELSASEKAIAIEEP